jgi:hypothetical protein
MGVLERKNIGYNGKYDPLMKPMKLSKTALYQILPTENINQYVDKTQFIFGCALISIALAPLRYFVYCDLWSDFGVGLSGATARILRRHGQTRTCYPLWNFYISRSSMLQPKTTLAIAIIPHSIWPLYSD